MSTLKKFEDLEIWQLARQISLKIFKITKDIDMYRHSGIVNQVRDASGSVMDNIAEGFEREGNKEFKQYLYIAKGSNGETRSQLYRLLDQELISKKSFDDVYNESVLLTRKIKKFIEYLKESDLSGQKYR
jgi:four helix bundle protein